MSAAERSSQKPTASKRPWWKKKRVLVGLAAAVLGLVVVNEAAESIVVNTLLDAEIERGRQSRLCEAHSGPDPADCHSPHGLVRCSPGRERLKAAEVWRQHKGRTKVEKKVRTEFERLGSFEELAIWFACQGFVIPKRDNIIYISSPMRFGYGFFENSLTIIPSGENLIITIEGENVDFRHGFRSL